MDICDPKDAVTDAEKSSVPTGHIDEARMHRERLARARAALRRHGLPAALLFDPINVRYAAVPGAFAVFNLHVAFRWALVPVESEPVLWEYPRPCT